MKNIINIQAPQQPQVVVDQDPDTMRTNYVIM